MFLFTLFFFLCLLADNGPCLFFLCILHQNSHYSFCILLDIYGIPIFSMSWVMYYLLFSCARCSLTFVFLTCPAKRRHVNVTIGTEELLTNVIFLTDICLFNICFNFNISSSTQHYNNIFITVWDPKMYCNQTNLFICEAWWWSRWAETCSLVDTL